MSHIRTTCRGLALASILTALLGMLAVRLIPITQYPNITPPQVYVTTTYPGAAETNDGRDNQCPGDVGAGLVDESGIDSRFDSKNDVSIALTFKNLDAVEDYRTHPDHRAYVDEPIG